MLTRYGKPYVRYQNNMRTDGIAQAWQKLVAKAGVRELGSKYLRKTGADMVRRLGGLEMPEIHLAHSEKTLGRVYSNPDFDKLAGALRAMEVELEDVLSA